jgi:toxin secretion/phage lysis holin
MIPEKYLQYIGISKMGICELFCLLFILYEIVSILKNMTLCGLPVPTRLKLFIQKFLDDMTEELPEEVVEELHKEDVQQLEGE